MLLGGGYDEEGIMRFGLAVQSDPGTPRSRGGPARPRSLHRPQAAGRDLPPLRAAAQSGDRSAQMTNDLAKPAELFPDIYQDWGDEVGFSLQLGRGECAA